MFLSVSFCVCVCVYQLGPGRASPNLELINGYPAIGGEALQHGYKELEAARPVAHQQHHADQVEDPHEDARHVQELR